MAGWRANGTVLIACNCDWGCPCNFNARPSRGYCQGGWIWVFDRAHVGDVQLDGLGLAVFAKWPGAIHEGGGHAACYVDDRADVPQRAALERLLHGELGGPWAIFIKTYDLAAPALARFNVDLAQYATTARLGNAVFLTLQTMRNPVTQAEVHPEIVLPEGLVVKRAAVAASKEFRVGTPVEIDHSGQYAAFGQFDYS